MTEALVPNDGNLAGTEASSSSADPRANPQFAAAAGPPNGERVHRFRWQRRRVEELRASWARLSLIDNVVRWNLDGGTWTDITVRWSTYVVLIAMLLGAMGVGGLAKDVVTIISQLDMDVDLLLYSIFLDLLHMTAGMIGMLASAWKSVPTATLFLLCLLGDAAMLLTSILLASQSYRGHPVLLMMAFFQATLLLVFLFVAKAFHAALKMEERMRSTPNYNRRAVLTEELALQQARLLQPAVEEKHVPEEVVERLSEQLGVGQDVVLKALSAAKNDVALATTMLVSVRNTFIAGPGPTIP